MIRRLNLFLACLCCCIVILAPVHAQPDYTGMILTVITQDAPEISTPIDQYRSGWEAETGAIVSIQVYPFGDLYGEIMSAVENDTAAYDILVYPASWSGDIMGGGHVIPIPEEVQAAIDWEDILPIYRERIAAWGGTTYALPFDGDSHMMYYRRDLVNPDSVHADEFESEYGYVLDEPQTWAQYEDIARFFHRQTVNTGGFQEPIFGVSEAQRGNAQSFWFYISRAAGYAHVPDDPCFFFSCTGDTPMTPRVNNPGWVRALEDWITIRPLGAPNMSNYDIVDVRRVFPAGESVFALDWGDIGPTSQDLDRSLIREDIGFGVLPGGDQYWDHSAEGGAGAWVTPESGVNQAPFLAFGGWVISIAEDSPNQQAALEFAAYMADRDLANILVTTSGSGVNPLRISQFRNLQIWLDAGFTEEASLDYLQAIEDTIRHPQAVLDLRIPGAADYLQALDRGVQAALEGDLDAQEALDAVYAEWETITDRYGREAQLEFYRQSLGL